MNWKAAVLLLTLFFASTVTAVAISFNLPKIGRLSTSDMMTLDGRYEPMGDPIDGPDAPN